MTKIKNPAVIINASSGSTSDITTEASDILGRYCETSDNIVFVEAPDLDDAIQSAIDAGSDVIITYGGDGTSLSAARAAGAKDIPIIPLPGGTMNVLPKALYGTDNWQEVLTLALEEGEAQWRPAGIIGDKLFLVAAIIGTPARIGRVREAIRDRNLVQATKLAVDAVMDIKPEADFDYALDEDTVFKDAANLLTVTCPGMNAHATSEKEFDVTAIKARKISDLAGLGLTAIMSHWRKDDSAAVNNAAKVTLSGVRKLSALLDGEFENLTLPVDVTLKTKGVKVIAPQNI